MVYIAPPRGDKRPARGGEPSALLCRAAVICSRSGLELTVFLPTGPGQNANKGGRGQRRGRNDEVLASKAEMLAQLSECFCRDGRGVGLDCRWKGRDCNPCQGRVRGVPGGCALG